jgi:hypothetical protein
MSIEVTNTSGQLVPADQLTSLLTFALGVLDLNPANDLSVSFVKDDYISEHN